MLSLSYAYALEGPMLFHGIGLNAPAAAQSDVRGLLRGPDPVWQNRLRGPVLGVHTIASPTGDKLPSPATADYYADPRWVQFGGVVKGLTVSVDGAPYLQLGIRLTDYPRTTAAFPTTNLGFMQAIPAIGTKGQRADSTGPAGQPSVATGRYEGRVSFSL